MTGLSDIRFEILHATQHLLLHSISFDEMTGHLLYVNPGDCDYDVTSCEDVDFGPGLSFTLTPHNLSQFLIISALVVSLPEQN
jgi:hypothetical protein